MSLLEAFRGLVDSSGRVAKRTDGVLRDLYCGFMARAARLEGTADRAPSDTSAAELRRLADDHRRAAEMLRNVLTERGVSVPSDTGAVEAAEGFNHWARAVADLAVLQDGHARILDAAAAIGEHNPDLTPVFDRLTRTSAEHITRLRGQIARADPQARN